MPESITSADLGILAAIPRTQFLDRIMPVVTVIGDNGIIPIIIALILICIPKTRKTGIAMGIAFALGGIFGNLLLKNIVARTRPYDVVDGIKLLVPALSDYSFPSGHTLVCFEAATVAFVRERKYIGICAYVIAAAVAYSRLYLYVHYPTDVLAGIILGIIFGITASYLVDGFLRRRKMRAENTPDRA